MALTIDGVPVSGSVGYTTHARNRAGAYTRNRTKPVNPNSTRQTTVRSGFAAAVDAWTNTLTDTQRAEWNLYAANVPWLNKAGQSMRMTGQNAFIRFYSFYQSCGLVPTSLTAPIIFDTSSIAVTGNSVSVDNSVAATFTAALAQNDWNATGGVIAESIA